MIAAKFAAVVVIGYLIGSIPFGVLIGRRESGTDVRSYGSGKMGTTNVLRTAGRKAATAVGVLDFLKGAASAAIAGLIIGSDTLELGGFITLGMVAGQALGGLGAMAGHILPVFAGFRGGRGVFTFFGALGVMAPLVAIFGGEVFLLGTWLSRYVSIGSMAGTVATVGVLVPLAVVTASPVEPAMYAIVGAVIILFTHRDNIARLVAGKERRLGEKVSHR